MRETYDKAMTKVYEDEGGYTNDAADPGGPTNWGITIADARMYWKPDASADDVRHMPKEVAADIYKKHYADPIQYDNLPAGVDYAVFDYGINSGISRAIKVLQKLVGAPVDGKIGTQTITLVNKTDAKKLINAIYDERLAFLQSLSTWSTFGKGWGRRVKEGRALALSMVDIKPKALVIAPVVVAGSAAAVAAPHYWHYILIATIAVSLISAAYYLGRKKTNVTVA